MATVGELWLGKEGEMRDRVRNIVVYNKGFVHSLPHTLTDSSFQIG